MDSSQLLSLARNMLAFAGGIVTSKGWVDEETMTTISGVVMTIVPVAWGMWSRRPAGMIASVAALPSVHKIVADHAVANSPQFIGNQMVVAPDSLGSDGRHS